MSVTELAAKADRPAAVPTDGRGHARFDFREQHRLARDTVRSLEVAHELFARRISSGWGSALRALVQVEPLSVDQVSYDAYIRSMPSPHVVTAVAVPGLPGHAVIELNADLALAFVGRLLGGRVAIDAGAGEVRRPTELEAVLLADLLDHAGAALDETLAPVTTGPAQLLGVEYNPQLVQVAAPSDEVVVLSFLLSLSQGVEAEGLLTVCYPLAFLTPVLDHLTAQVSAEAAPPEADAAARQAVTDRLEDAPVTVRVRLAESRLPARALAALQVGDVIRLDHRIGQPARGEVGGIAVFDGHIGRRGQRLAVQVAQWVAPPPPPAPGTTASAPPLGAAATAPSPTPDTLPGAAR